jgi:hypothetical protein
MVDLPEDAPNTIVLNKIRVSDESQNAPDEADDKEGDAPDYEIVEDKGEAQTSPAEDRAQQRDERDERLGRKRDEDRPKLSNRERRHLRKENLRKKIDAKDGLIRQLQEENAQIKNIVGNLDGRIANLDQAQFTTAWNEAVSSFQDAEKQHIEAFGEADAAKATEAMRKMYNAQKRIDELDAIKQRAAQQAQPRQQPQANPRVTSKAQEWAARNAWFDPAESDDDSAVANVIAAKIAKEGYDPATDDYWDELDERLQARGIGKPDDEGGDDEAARPAPRKRVSPPVSGGGGRHDLPNGKVQISLPTAYIDNLKQAGMWDDVDKRNKMIKKYLDGIKNREAAE